RDPAVVLGYVNECDSTHRTTSLRTRPRATRKSSVRIARASIITIAAGGATPTRPCAPDSHVSRQAMPTRPGRNSLNSTSPASASGDAPAWFGLSKSFHLARTDIVDDAVAAEAAAAARHSAGIAGTRGVSAMVRSTNANDQAKETRRSSKLAASARR